MKICYKHFCITLCSLFFLSKLSYGQNHIDFGNFNSLEKVSSFFNSNENKSNFAYGNYKTYEKGFWNEIPIEDIVLRENELTFSISKNSKNATQNIIDFLKKNYPDDLNIDINHYETHYKINNKSMLFDLKIDIQEDEPIEENTKSKISIVFREISNNRLAQISSNIKSNSQGINYFLVLDFFQISPKIYLNGLPIYTKTAQNRYMYEESVYLNPYLLNSKNTISLKIILEPGLDSNKKSFENIIKESYFTAYLESVKENDKKSNTDLVYNNREYVTDTIVENGKTKYSHFPGNSKYGKKNIEIEYSFVPNVMYDISGWNNGKDLRLENDLEVKIKQFYKDFAKLILSKNTEKLTAFLYNKYEDYYTYTHNIGNRKSHDDYENWLETVNSSFKYILANETKLYISDDGKLAFLDPLDKQTNLKMVGKNYTRNLDFYFYIDNNTNELKISR